MELLIILILNFDFQKAEAPLKPSENRDKGKYLFYTNNSSSL